MTWKLTEPRLWSRLKRGWSTGKTNFVSLSTVLAFLFTLVSPGPMSAGGIVIVVLVVFMLSVTSAWFSGQSTMLSPPIVEEMGEGEQYSAQYCTPEHLHEACEMTKLYYGDEYVEGNVAEQWRAKNPYGFVEVINASGELCACFGLLGLTDDFRSQFFAGNATDTKLRAADVLGPDETKRCRALYISGIVVRDPMTLRSGKRTRVMLWVLIQYYKDHFKFRISRTLYALAANKESEKLLKVFQFNLCREGATRRDKCNLYEVTMNKQKWEEMIKKVWNLSAICKVHWEK